MWHPVHDKPVGLLTRLEVAPAPPGAPREPGTPRRTVGARVSRFLGTLPHDVDDVGVGQDLPWLALAVQVRRDVGAHHEVGDPQPLVGALAEMVDRELARDLV
nr:hypothetical protein GCM10020241_30020 [Streptoalloteichus tenebrarius]